VRRFGSLILIPLVAICAMSVGVASAGAKTKVLCWNKDYPEPVGNGNAQVRVKPSKCAFFKRGESSNSGAVRVVSMHWKRWGNRKAKGKGVTVASMGVRAKVVVRLSKPVRNCAGKRMFSKATFKHRGSRSVGSRSVDFKLYTCPNQRLRREDKGGASRVRRGNGPDRIRVDLSTEAFVLTSLKWFGTWRERTARGHGKVRYIPCACAFGPNSDIVERRARVKLRRIRTCHATGVRRYTKFKISQVSGDPWVEGRFRWPACQTYAEGPL
jgi:hypothetical protein